MVSGMLQICLSSLEKIVLLVVGDLQGLQSAETFLERKKLLMKHEQLRKDAAK